MPDFGGEPGPRADESAVTRRANHPSVRAHVADAKPEGATCPTLAANQACLAQAYASHRYRDVLGHLLSTVATRARHGLRLRLDDRRAADG
jgi:hypothetical protein